MSRRTLVVTATVIAMLLPVGPVSAESAQSGQASLPDAAHADLDGNGLSRAVETRLDNAAPNESIEVIVSWDRRPDHAAAQAAAGPFQVIQEFVVIDAFLATARPAQIRALANVAGVTRIDTNFEVFATNEEADVDYGTEQARADFTVDGTDINVCVLDTGADPQHEQLDSQILGFFDAINGLTTSYDDQGHGTHVAATVAGDGDGASADAARYQGIAPGAGLYIAKVLSGAGSGTTAQIISGIDWCVLQPGVRIISMSLGTSSGSDGLDALSVAVNNAVLDYDVVATVAAGNSGDGPESVGSPGAAQHAITVGAASKFGAGLHLAPFSSRGPNLSGLLKPEIVSPGVAIVSADAGTAAGYFAASGTSMATPFTAGTVALALDANPGLDPATVKSMLTSTARDVGVSGPDNNWGYGLIDGYGLVSAALGGTASSDLPTHTQVSGSVANNGLWSYSIPIAGDDVGEPLGITILIDGQLECSLFFFGFCLIWEWSPDLDARLIDPNGAITDSRCALEGDCGTTGVQETYHVSAALEGTYTLEIYPFAGDPNNGQGGGFDVDIFTGTAGATTPPPNQVPQANAGADQVVPDTDALPGELVTLDGSASFDPDGTIQSWVWTEGGVEIATGANPTVLLSDGVHTITLTVTDDQGATDTDDVIVTVEAPPPPPNTPPVADPDNYSVAEDTQLSVSAPGVLSNDSDADGDSITVISNTNPTNGNVTVNADGSFTYDPNPNYSGPDSFDYTIGDGNGGTDSATVSITVTAVNDPPIADAGPDQTVPDSNGGDGENVALDGTASSDLEGALTYSWTEGGSEIATGANPTVPLSDGVHTITLTVTDAGGLTDTDTVVITVQAAPPPDTIHVGDLDGSSQSMPKGRWQATATVTIHDAVEGAVNGATVTFALSTGGTATCVTSGSGQCFVTSPQVKKKESNVTFTVTNVVLADQTYNATDNHDPDGDSDGTSIAVAKP